MACLFSLHDVIATCRRLMLWQLCLFVVSLSNYALCKNSYKFRSSYNKCIKKLFGFQRLDSMSGILIECLPTADTVVHNARFLFDQLCTASCNNIVNIVMCLVAIGKGKGSGFI